MAQFTFPITVAQFEKMLTKEGKAQLGELLATDDGVSFAFSCFRMGWMNKQHHKQKQMRDREAIEKFRELERNDPERFKQLMKS